MKIRKCFAQLIAAVAVALPHCPRAHAADSAASNRTADAKGAVTGRVQNALSGHYLNNVRVTIRGTDRSVFTNEEGTYLINDAPAGEIVLEIFYTGLDPQTVALNVPAGQRVERDVQLNNSGARCVERRRAW